MIKGAIIIVLLCAILVIIIIRSFKDNPSPCDTCQDHHCNVCKE
jgi:hypothetical protein